MSPVEKCGCAILAPENGSRGDVAVSEDLLDLLEMYWAHLTQKSVVTVLLNPFQALNFDLLVLPKQVSSKTTAEQQD